jgi:hypothetical protein
MNYRYILFLGLLGLLFSCKPELDDFSTSQGNADFSTYVSLGNSLTAGYADAALYKSGQENSYVSILAQQFQKAGGGEFSQPLISTEEGVGFSAQPTGLVFRTKSIIGYSTDCLGNTSLAPVPAIQNPNQSELYNVLFSPINGLYNNLGVPGAKSFHLLYNGYGNPANLMTNPPTANPYFVRFASSPTTTILGDALAQNPTFFTLWIGNNDVLGYATSGGMGDTITGQATYGYVINTLLTALTSNGAKGAIANIPDVTDIPFFTTIPPNGYVVTQSQADTLNMFLGGFGFHYNAGPNYFIISDPGSALGFRQMVQGELLLLTLPQDSLKCAFWGGFNPYLQLPVPIPGQFVLTNSEIDQIEYAVEGYNATLSALATQYDLAFIDMNSKLNDLKQGIISEGIKLTDDFITGNAFSLDGVHLTPMGYAYVANQFILGINSKYGSNLPIVSLTNYQSVILP